MKMKKSLLRVSALLLVIMFAACSSTPSLQEYYVDKSENPNFLSIDLPASLLNLGKANLTAEEKEAVTSLRKLNILAFKKTDGNEAEFLKERLNVNEILKNGKFTELMKMNTQYGKASVKYLGKEEAIDEVIIYGDSDEKGFLLVRILGKDMNPAKLVQFIQAMEKSDYKGEGLEQLMDL